MSSDLREVKRGREKYSGGRVGHATPTIAVKGFKALNLKLALLKGVYRMGLNRSSNYVTNS